MATAPLATAVRALARRRAPAVWLAVSALAGAALTRLPLFEVPGWELSSAMTILVAIGGMIAGVASARLARGSLEAGSSLVLRAFAPAALLCLATLVLPFAAAVLGSLLLTRCSPWLGVGFYALLPIPSALLCCAAGVLAGLAFSRARTAALALVAVALASLAISLWPLWDGPQVFALDHLFGYFPGPLYDEALEVEPRLLTFRALTLAWTELVLLVGAWLVDPATGRLRRPRLRTARTIPIAVLATILILSRAFSFELGLRTRDGDLERELGGRSETAHFVLVFPREKDEADVRRLERDLEYKYDRVVAFLGQAPTGKIHAFFHASADSKHRLVGASETSFAKPWRLEFHVQDEPFPHPVARHEMAHDIAAAFGAWPFGVSARALIVVNAGLVEGLAVAADERADELTLHEWAAAMRRLSLAPDVRDIVGPAGFYRQSAARAYTLAGSFLRYLGDKYGPAKLRAAYRHGDFEGAYGRPLADLVGEWEAFLDALPLDPRSLHTAQLRFARGSMFDRPCARELARISDEADLMQAADPQRALALYRRCEAIEPQNPAHLRSQAELLARQHDHPAARGAWRRILELPGASPGARATALMGVGDTDWALGELLAARDAFQAALALHRDRATDRTATIKLEALADPLAEPLLVRFFEGATGLPDLSALEELAQKEPGSATAHYLLGRQLALRGKPARAVEELERALALGPADEDVRREALRVLVRAHYLAGDCAGARPAIERLAQGGPADKAISEDWRDRCDFELRSPR